MKRLWCLVMMLLLLAGCSGGGGGGSADKMGTLKVSFHDASAKAAAKLPDLPEPEWVRVVATKGTSKEIIDVQLGSIQSENPSASMNLATGNYRVEAIYYANYGGIKKVLYYGGTSAEEVPITAGSIKNVMLTMNETVAPALTYTSDPANTVRYGYTFDIGADTASTPYLQPEWSHSVQTAAYTVFPHLSTPAAAGAHTLTVPDAANLYILGEFFLNPRLLNSGEVPTNWVVNSLQPLTLQVLGSPVTLNGGGVNGFSNYSSSGSIYTDIWPPQVTSFVAPLQTSATGSGGIRITATDNVTMADNISVIMTPTRQRPTSTPYDDLKRLADKTLAWQSDNAAVSLPVGTNINIGATDTKQTFWAWAKDRRGNVSFTNVSTVVTFNNSPQIKYFGLYSSGVVQRTSFPINLTAQYYTSGTSYQFCVQESSKLAECTWRAWAPNTAIPNLMKYVFTPSLSVPTTLTSRALYAWVRDDRGVDGTSGRSQFYYNITSKPIISSTTNPTSKDAATATVSGIGFKASAMEGRNITQYVITTATTAPSDGWTAVGTAANKVTLTDLSYDFGTAFPAAGTGYVKLYLYVKDSATPTAVVSDPAFLYVRF